MFLISEYLGYFPFLSLILCPLTSVHTSNHPPHLYFSYFHCIDHGLCYACGQLDISFLGGQKSNLSVLEFSMNKCSDHVLGYIHGGSKKEKFSELLWGSHPSMVEKRGFLSRSGFPSKQEKFTEFMHKP